MANLSPEDIMLMKKAIAEAEGGAQSHSDLNADIQLIKPLIQAVEFLAQHLDTACERIEKLEKVVMDDIVGGITNLYKTNMRESSISSLKEKYGSMFDPYKSAIDAFYPGVDIYDKLQDLLEEMREKEDYSDEAFDGSVQEAVKDLQAKIAALTGHQDQDSAAAVAPEAPKAVEVEVTTTKAGEGDDVSKMLEKFKRMKERAPKDLKI